MADHPVPASHKSLSQKELELLQQDAFDYELRVKKAAGNIHEAWWRFASELFRFHEGGYWQVLGYDSLAEFLAQPDLGLSRSQFFQMTKTWRDLVEVKKIKPERLAKLEPSKVREVVPAIMRGDVKPKDALADAESLSYTDVKKKYRLEEQQKSGQKADNSTPLDASSEPETVQCSACGSWYTPAAPDLEGTATEV
jgi:hypothetical protein